MDFVNQQHDYLMGIRFVEATNQYELNVSLATANKISQSCAGRDFDLEEWIKLAKEELPKHDNEAKQEQLTSYLLKESPLSRPTHTY